MNSELQFLGELSPLQASRNGRIPYRREVSKRWLAGSVLVGMTSVFLMGGALFAALDGREQLTLPAQAYEKSDLGSSSGLALKGNHPGLVTETGPSKTRVMMVSTLTRSGNENVVKQRPFLHVAVPLARNAGTQLEYATFNPLAIFSESGKAELIAKNSDVIYGADVESEVKLKVVEFPVDSISSSIKPRQNAVEIEKQVRRLATDLNTDNAAVSALAYFDEERFSHDGNTFLAGPGVVITTENVSILGKKPASQSDGLRYEKRMIPIRGEASIATIFETEGLAPSEAASIETVLASDLGTNILKLGDSLQAYYQIIPSELGQESPPSLARVSVFRGKTHLVSIAKSDEGRFVYAIKPDDSELNVDDDTEAALLSGSRLPSAYDAIYRSAISEGLTSELTADLVKIFAFDVDFKSKITPKDELAIFVSLEDGRQRPTEESEILYASITLGGLKRRYYRFRDGGSGQVDYYDETGKSAKKFLLRQPVPNGRFRSPFGKRWHPILKYRKMHWGVDWAAPRGTPILAAGNGVIKEAGWSGSGYGKQTILRHTNGYETSYSHQTAIAKGIRPGVRVKQGQVIGYVGSTGLSTGPHLHYEVSVNKNRVDPMRIRLPNGKVLKDEELAKFEAERDRIDNLVGEEEEPTRVASN